MPLGLSVSRLVNINLVISPVAAQFANFDTALVVGDSNVIDVVQRLRSYESLTDVGADFGITTPEYKAASLFFSQSPKPASLYIGRWAKAATAAILVGGPRSAAQQAIAVWTAIVNGAFLVYEDGVPRNITGLNFGAQTNLNGVATIIQAAMVALEAGSTVVFDAVADVFRLASGTTGAASTMSFLQTSAGVGSAVFAGQPAANDTLTIAGTAITFVAAGPVGNQVLIGASLAATLASLLALLNGSADVNLSKATYSLVGSTIYMVSKLPGVTGNAYTLAKAGANITVSGATFAGGSAGTDISSTLGGTAADSGSYVAQGLAAESATAAVQALDGLATQWYALAFAASAYSATDVLNPTDTLAVAAYVEGAGNPHLFGVTTSQGAAITSTDTTSIGYLLNQLGYRRTFYQYSSSSLYAAVSILGRGCTVNFNESLSTINFMWRQEPGVVAEQLSSSQADALDARRYNYFAAFQNSTSIIVNGTVPSGFIDETWDLDWFVNQMQTDVYNALYTLPKIPQTDSGEHLLNNAIVASCNAAVNNGTLAPGIWNGPGFGQLQTGDLLSTGFYVYQPPVSSQAQADREARKSVAFQVAVKLAGAVNTVSITVNVNR